MWSSATDTYSTQLAEQCQLPPLEGLTLALTGFDAHERETLAARIDMMGGIVAPKLTWDGSITHLVCAPPMEGRSRKGLDRVLAHRTLAAECDLPHVLAAVRIRLVHAAWIEDCFAARVQLPESPYDAMKEVDTEPRRAERVASLKPRLLERTTSVPVSTDTSHDFLATSTSTHGPAPMPVGKASLPASLPVSQPTSQQVPGTRMPEPGSLLSYTRSASFQAPTPGVFHACQFHIDMQDDARTRRVAAVVRRAGGAVLADRSVTADYAVGPLTQPVQCLPARVHVTHHWIERCLYDDKLVDPHMHVALRPATRSLPMAEARAWSIAVTGLDKYAPDYHHTCAAIEALGATMTTTFSRHASTHLLCTDEARTGPKAQKAEEWHIPIIGTDFLEHALRPPAMDVPPRKRARPMPRRSATEGMADVHTNHGLLPHTGRETGSDLATAPWLSDYAHGPWAVAKDNDGADHHEHSNDAVAAAADGAGAIADSTLDASTTHVWYDDPAARREHTRLMALVGDASSTRPAKKKAQT